MTEEEKTQETSTEQKIEEKSPVAPKSGEQVIDNEKEQLQQEIELYKNRAAKWQRKHDELKKTVEEKPETTYPYETTTGTTQTDPLASLREQHETDPFTTSMQMADRAGRHYAEKVRTQLKKETKVKRQLARQYKDFDTYEDRVDELIEKMAPDARTSDMYEMAYKVAKTEASENKNEDQIRKEAKEEGLKEGAQKTLEEAKEIHTVTTPQGGVEKSLKTVKLSPDEEKIAARYGMTNEQYAQWKTQKITGGEKARFE